MVPRRKLRGFSSRTRRNAVERSTDSTYRSSSLAQRHDAHTICKPSSDDEELLILNVSNNKTSMRFKNKPLQKWTQTIWVTWLTRDIPDTFFWPWYMTQSYRDANTPKSLHVVRPEGNSFHPSVKAWDTFLTLWFLCNSNIARLCMETITPLHSHSAQQTADQ